MIENWKPTGREALLTWVKVHKYNGESDDIMQHTYSIDGLYIPLHHIERDGLPRIEERLNKPYLNKF